MNLVFQERKQDLLGPMVPQDLQDPQDPRDPQGFQGFLEFQEQLLWDHPALQVLLVLKDPLASRDLLVSSCFSTPQASSQYFNRAWLGDPGSSFKWCWWHWCAVGNAGLLAQCRARD